MPKNRGFAKGSRERCLPVFCFLKMKRKNSSRKQKKKKTVKKSENKEKWKRKKRRKRKKKKNGRKRKKKKSEATPFRRPLFFAKSREKRMVELKEGGAMQSDGFERELTGVPPQSGRQRGFCRLTPKQRAKLCQLVVGVENLLNLALRSPRPGRGVKPSLAQKSKKRSLQRSLRGVPANPPKRVRNRVKT